MVVLHLSKINSTLGTRALGKRLREQIESGINSKSIVLLDFEGVSFISHSFADECFGKLLVNNDLTEIQSFTSFKNVGINIEKTIINSFNVRDNRKITT